MIPVQEKSMNGAQRLANRKQTIDEWQETAIER